jgi:alpha-L-arabinofuranosidase
MKRWEFPVSTLFAAVMFLPCFAQQKNLLSVDFSQKGTTIPSSMYGVFFEEISHAGDGGLYAELIQNRGFEDKDTVPTCKIENGYLIPPRKPNYLKEKTGDWKLAWDTFDKWPGWSLRAKGLAKGFMKLTTAGPLNAATPHSMEMQIVRAVPQEQVELVNSGYWGIAVKKDEAYHVRFYLKADNSYAGTVTVKLRNHDDGIIAKQELTLKSTGEWTEYTCTLVPRANETKARFMLGFNATGKVWVDFVSMFPEKTFKNRPNGLREDVATMIAGLKPAFVRWPGGCIVEGLTLEDRVKWKETLGDPVNRPGVFDLWGYRNSYGFGYHEYLQFCEDIGAAAMFVCNAGLSCAYCNGDYCADEDVPSYVKDVLDAIEYAIGDTTTVWGAKRAANGHSAPFPLRYVEIGNENYGPLYARRFNVFYKTIKEKYPDITVISTLRFDPELSMLGRTDMIDPHFYVQPEWFYGNADLFDHKQPRPDFKVYVGEYAANRGVGNGNMNAALSEAAFMTGMERNSDLVTMCSYAPLIENSNARNWPVNLIWLKSNQVFGRSSYYVQQLFAQNRPDVNLKTDLQLTGTDLPKEKFKGSVGLGSSKTQVVYKDFMVEVGNATEYHADFVNHQNDWEPVRGHWRLEAGNYVQGDLEAHRASFLRNRLFENCTVEVKAKKNKGEEGFVLLFGGVDAENYYQFNVGGYGNKKITLEKVEGSSSLVVSDSIPFTVEENRWYTLRITIKGDEVNCLVDDKPVLNYTIKELEKRYAVAGFDQSKNEIVVKVVNAESIPFKTNVKLSNTGVIDSKGEAITLSAKSKNEENTFKNPMDIYPETSVYKGFSNEFTMEFKPYSLTVLRIKRK